jgi:hypothetical protein
LIAASRSFGRGRIHLGQGGLQRIGASSRRGGKSSLYHFVLLLLLLLRVSRAISIFRFALTF